MLYQFRSKFLIVCLFGIYACNPTEQKRSNGNPIDTTQIITKVLEEKNFIAENKRIDSLYFLKNKFYNRTWPHSTATFKLAFIENNSRSRMLNIGPSFPYDKRQRFSVEKFEINNDTCHIMLLEHRSNLFYETQLVYKDKKWKVEDTQIHTGGRADKFEFEDEDWYIKWKQKILKPKKSEL